MDSGLCPCRAAVVGPTEAAVVVVVTVAVVTAAVAFEEVS